MKLDRIIIKNYKCFDDTGCIIENLKPINIIIGKNNSGKSSLVEVINFLTSDKVSFANNKRGEKNSQILIEHVFSKELIGDIFPRSYSTNLPKMTYQVYAHTFHGATLTYSLEEKDKKKFIGINKEFLPEVKPYFERYTSGLKTPLRGKIFKHLKAERDIQPEQQNENINLSSNGVGATNLIQQIINRNTYNSDIIEKSLLEELNQILNPDIKFTRILVQQNEEKIWEIYFENEDDERIALSNMGSGVKTILLVLLLLNTQPKIEKRKPNEYVFALEELENNLHPSLQRRLYRYLYQYTNENDCILFLTTHSNIVIDLFNSLSDSQIFHIQKKDGITSALTTMQQSHFKQILEDLDVRASDILQSNCILWVEGPSDRVFLNKWISLIDEELVEGYHYSIMFYGGRLLSNLSFKYETIESELIPLLKLNPNAFVIIDRDGKQISAKLNETKTRIQKEIGEENAWITKGREIENYLSNRLIQEWLTERYNIKEQFENDKDTKLEESIAKISNIKYNLKKNGFAKEISNFIKTEDLEILDLHDKILTIVNKVKYWNRK